MTILIDYKTIYKKGSNLIQENIMRGYNIAIILFILNKFQI
jgi:hypothetical protein